MTITLESPTKSALPVLCANNINDGEIFAADYWVYKNGKRIRKWFEQRGYATRVWPPNLNNISGLIKLARKIDIVFDKFMIEKYYPITELFYDGGKNKDKHWFVKTTNGLLEYSISEYQGYLGIANCYSLKHEEPSAIGLTLHVISRRWDTLSRRYWKIMSAITEAAILLLPVPEIQGQTAMITHEGSVFWFVVDRNRFGILRWEALEKSIKPPIKIEV